MMPLTVAAADLGNDASPARDKTCLLPAKSLVRQLPVLRSSHVTLVLYPLSRARVRREVTLPPCQTGQCPCPVHALDLLPDIGYVGRFHLARAWLSRILLPAYHGQVKNPDMGMPVRTCRLFPT